MSRYAWLRGATLCLHPLCQPPATQLLQACLSHCKLSTGTCAHSSSSTKQAFEAYATKTLAHCEFQSA
eukprot:4916065-Amphidinium_carterae.1